MSPCDYRFRLVADPQIFARINFLTLVVTPGRTGVLFYKTVVYEVDSLTW